MHFIWMQEEEFLLFLRQFLHHTRSSCCWMTTHRMHLLAPRCPPLPLPCLPLPLPCQPWLLRKPPPPPMEPIAAPTVPTVANSASTIAVSTTPAAAHTGPAVTAATGSCAPNLASLPADGFGPSAVMLSGPRKCGGDEQEGRRDFDRRSR
ncbi:hypothetical protein SKAU_G00383960 [Synaphobranchus kaupii]|uniref:Uncharacterized protein n=1 Tax=Synaphobranchus kaupii TaxID=118154 RepID=A0A9Q1EE80_SYNKA|nr:hypothetical protein SKAU_G00383960 [Synaphobranchus kaupii]